MPNVCFAWRIITTTIATPELVLDAMSWVTSLKSVEPQACSAENAEKKVISKKTAEQ
jgi:hypothetical protein